MLVLGCCSAAAAADSSVITDDASFSLQQPSVLWLSLLVGLQEGHPVCKTECWSVVVVIWLNPCNVLEFQSAPYHHQPFIAVLRSRKFAILLWVYPVCSWIMAIKQGWVIAANMCDSSNWYTMFLFMLQSTSVTILFKGCSNNTISVPNNNQSINQSKHKTTLNSTFCWQQLCNANKLTMPQLTGWRW